MSRPASPLAAVLVALVLAASLAATAAAPAAESAKRARDCVADAMLGSGHADSIRFVVWCSVLRGEFRFQLQRGKGENDEPPPPIVAFTAHPAVNGAGEVRPASCRLHDEELRCHGNKSAQVVVQGWIQVPPGTRCAFPVRIETSFTLSGGRPHGCPGRRPYRPDFRRGYMRSYRANFGLLQGIEGNPKAIDRRLDAAIRNWLRGEPVARVSDTEVGTPLLPFEERAIVFRNELLRSDARKLEHWVEDQPTDTYAGYYVEEGLRATLRVGFTADQAAQLAAFKREMNLFAPGQVKPFPDPPRFTERQLFLLAEAVWEPPESALAELINSSGVNTELNKVEVGTLQVAEVQRLLTERYGPDAPFLVVRQSPARF